MKPKGIQFHLLLLGIIPSCILVLPLTLYFIFEHYSELDLALRIKGETAIKQLAISSVYGVVSGNIDALEEITQALLAEPDISLVKISDSNGVVLIKKQKSGFMSAQPHLFLEHPVVLKSLISNPESKFNLFYETEPETTSKHVGKVYIALSTHQTQQKQITFLFNSLIFVIIGLFITILIALRMSRSISRPIIQMTNFAKHIAKGRFKDSDLKCNTLEINNLYQSLNQMAIVLQQTQNSLVQQVQRATAELNQALASLEQKNHSLEESTQEAITQSEIKSKFLAHISHEIRTPMNGILGFSELLKQSNLNDQQQNQINLIQTSATNLLSIVNEILDYSSLETGQFKIQQTQFNFRDMIESCAASVLPASNQVNIIVDIDINIPEQIISDAIRLRQIILNLLNNACKFTSQGNIIIRNKKIDNKLYISVSDTGLGIKKDQIPLLFEPFSQFRENMDGPLSGTGLGLSICKNILEQLGGDISVVSRHEVGTTFWFILPVIFCPSPAPPTIDKSILIIDDLKTRRQALAKQMSFKGYKTEALTLKDAFHITSQTPDIVFIAANLDIKNNFPNQKQFYYGQLGQLSNKEVDILLPCQSSYLCNLIESQTVQKPHLSIDNSEHPGNTNRFKSVFIADDNEINRLLLHAQLEPFCHHIALAKDGKEALYKLMQNPYDLILLDIQMPYLSGLELIGKIKKAECINRNSPVIAITAHAQSHQRKRLINAGFDECLIKPISLEQLIELSNLWLTNTLPNIPNPIQIICNDYHTTLLIKASGNKKLATSLLKKLFKELTELPEQIEDFIINKQYRNAEKTTHKLHGSVSFCGFKNLQSVLQELETSLAENCEPLINENFQTFNIQRQTLLSQKDEILKQLVEN